MSFADWLDRLFAQLGGWLCGFGEPACMGGYGAFVWASIVVTLLVLALNAVLPWRAHRRLLTQLGEELRDNAAGTTPGQHGTEASNTTHNSGETS